MTIVLKLNQNGKELNNILQVVAGHIFHVRLDVRFQILRLAK